MRHLSLFDLLGAAAAFAAAVVAAALSLVASGYLFALGVQLAGGWA